MESKGRERKNEKKFLMIVLGSLCFTAVVLIVIIAIVANLPKNSSESGTVVENETVVEETAPDYAQIAASHEEYLKATENINEALVAAGLYDLDKVLELYQQSIDSTENEYVKNMLMIDYYSVISNYDIDKTRGDEVINELLAIDARLESIDSAVAVLNAAAYYERADLVEQYTNIFNQRQIDAGIDPEMETEG